MEANNTLELALLFKNITNSLVNLEAKHQRESFEFDEGVQIQRKKLLERQKSERDKLISVIRTLEIYLNSAEEIILGKKGETGSPLKTQFDEIKKASSIEWFIEKKKFIFEGLKSVNDISDTFKRGVEFENLVITLFECEHDFILQQKRVKTGDEEIDLVFRNKVCNDPFWSKLSHCFFVECKNTKVKIGAKEIRNFEGKIRNHKNICDTGFFVSMNGYTSEAFEEIKRMGRDEANIRLTLIEGLDINGFCQSESDLLPWLENLITRIY